MKAWPIPGDVLYVPDGVRSTLTGSNDKSLLQLYLQLIRRRQLPKKWWYYVKWGYRTHRYLKLPGLLHPQRFSGGLHGYIDAKYGDWEIFKEVMED